RCRGGGPELPSAHGRGPAVPRRARPGGGTEGGADRRDRRALRLRPGLREGDDRSQLRALEAGAASLRIRMMRQKLGTTLLALTVFVSVLVSGGASLAAQEPSASPTPPSGPAVGDTIAPFDASNLEGKPTHVAFPKGSNTVLVFFLSSCPVCH